MRRPLLILLLFLPFQAHGQAQDRPAGFRLSPEGRLLYANDDDWNWASPLGSKEPCGLSVYGEMSWSALDWMEEGLTQVRGMLIGEPPKAGNYLTMADLNRVRRAGPKCGYDHRPHRRDLLAEILKGKDAPNVVILMQDLGPVRPEFSNADIEAVWHFVQNGGRLLILDDWQCYRDPMAPFLDKNRVKPRQVKALTEKQIAEVEARVTQLGDDTFKVREKAFSELIKMGPAILPILAKARPVTLEAQRRVERIETLLRPPPTILSGGDYMIAASKVLEELHPHCEVKSIVRDGPMLPGAALCLRFPHESSGKKAPAEKKEK